MIMSGLSERLRQMIIPRFLLYLPRIEQEIAELEDDEKKLFLKELGLSESGLDKLVKASYRILGLISYLTAGPKETKALDNKERNKAPQAARKDSF